MMDESESSRKESNITFSPMKTSTTHENEGKEKVFPVK